MASEDSERISFKHDFFFHWYFTEKPLKDFDFNNYINKSYKLTKNVNAYLFLLVLP